MERPNNLQQSLNDLFIPAIPISSYDCFMPTELIIRAFSYISFYERTYASLTCRAFYVAYRSCHADMSLMRLILAGDYISFIPAFCRETHERREAIITSQTFATLMIYAGIPMTKIYRVLSANYPMPSSLCNALIKKYGSFMGFIPDVAIGTGYVSYAVQYHHFAIAEQAVRTAGWLGQSSDVPTCRRSGIDVITGTTTDTTTGDLSDDDLSGDNEDRICDIEWFLTSFHMRCVSTSDTCMVHQTHKHLTSVMPQFVIDLHSRVEITLYQLHCHIHAARSSRNHDDDLWLQKRYPDMYLKALFYRPNNNDDEPRIDCCIKNVIDFGDDVAALRLMDKQSVAYRY